MWSEAGFLRHVKRRGKWVPYHLVPYPKGVINLDIISEVHVAITH